MDERSYMRRSTAVCGRKQLYEESALTPGTLHVIRFGDEVRASRNLMRDAQLLLGGMTSVVAKAALTALEKST